MTSSLPPQATVPSDNDDLAAPFLIWSHLAYHCHDKAALAFLSQWQGLNNLASPTASTSTNNSSQGGNVVQGKATPPTKKDAAKRTPTRRQQEKSEPSQGRPVVDNDVLSSQVWLTLECRKRTTIASQPIHHCVYIDLRQLIRDGKIPDALAYLSRHFPHITDRCRALLFRMQCQWFVELVRLGGYDQALEHAERVLAPAIRLNTGNSSSGGADLGSSLESHLNAVIELLAYKDPHTSPVAHLLSQERRDRLADDANAAILRTSRCFIAPDDNRVEEEMTKLEMLVRQAMCVEEECRRLDTSLLDHSNGSTEGLHKMMTVRDILKSSSIFC